MPQTCSICGHPERTAIELAIANRQPLRAIARQYSVSKDAVARHRDGCGAQPVIEARQEADVARQLTVKEELRGIMARVEKLYQACDDWLQDPEQPGRYELGPRAREIKVTYTEWVPAGDGVRPVVRSALLSVLLAKIEGTGRDVERVEMRQADPRMLLLKTCEQLTAQLQLLAKLTGELDERPQVNILVHPDWLALRDRILGALQPHPDALEGVIHAIGEPV
jgi:hypothetical protein